MFIQLTQVFLENRERKEAQIIVNRDDISFVARPDFFDGTFYNIRVDGVTLCIKESPEEVAEVIRKKG